MSSGVPVVFSGLGEMQRIISDANAGMVVPPEQVEPLVEHIVRLADDPVLARELGESGRRLCEREFSWGKIVQKWLGDMLLHPTERHIREASSSVGLVK
jgi:glycosyltransferase involved in cell wall biosynthesis